MQLKCVSEYRGTINPHTDEQGRYDPGDVIHVDPAIGGYLLLASPGSFEMVAMDPPAGDGIEGAPDRRARGGRMR